MKTIDIICLYPFFAKQPICLFIDKIERVKTPKGRHWFRIYFEDEPFVTEWLEENKDKIMYHKENKDENNRIQ